MGLTTPAFNKALKKHGKLSFLPDSKYVKDYSERVFQKWTTLTNIYLAKRDEKFLY